MLDADETVENSYEQLLINFTNEKLVSKAYIGIEAHL